MKKYIKQVTVTGASDDTSYDEMSRIQEKYPYVEWGILLSASQAGRSWRFPTTEWIQKSQWDNRSINMSGHLCGKWVKEILLGDLETSAQLRWWLGWHFKRIQINTHGIKHKWDKDKFFEVLTKYPDIQFIFQYDEVNKEIVETVQAAGFKNISALYDLSHGAGVLPAEWNPPLEELYTGYAGGLSPCNLEAQLSILDQVVSSEQVWIDAETHLRSNGDVNFDLDKVESFLETAKSRIID